MSTKNIITGTTSGTIAAGDDSRIVAVATNTSSINKLSLTPTTIKTTAYTAAVQELVLADATSAGFTVTLPTTPVDGTLVSIKKVDSSANVVTVTTGGSDTFIIGGTTLLLSLQGQTVKWRYQSSTSKWIATDNDLPLTSVDTRYATIATMNKAAGVVVYANSAYAARPSGFGMVMWIGPTSTPPTLGGPGMIDNDIFIGI